MSNAVMERVAVPEIREIPGSQAKSTAPSKPKSPPVVMREASRAAEGERNGSRVPTDERRT